MGELYGLKESDTTGQLSTAPCMVTNMAFSGDNYLRSFSFSSPGRSELEIDMQTKKVRELLWAASCCFRLKAVGKALEEFLSPASVE